VLQRKRTVRRVASGDLYPFRRRLLTAYGAKSPHLLLHFPATDCPKLSAGLFKRSQEVPRRGLPFSTSVVNDQFMPNCRNVSEPDLVLKRVGKETTPQCEDHIVIVTVATEPWSPVRLDLSRALPDCVVAIRGARGQTPCSVYVYGFLTGGVQEVIYRCKLLPEEYHPRLVQGGVVLPAHRSKEKQGPDPH
jgi:hypothetical protein